MRFKKEFQWDDGSANDYGVEGWSPDLGGETIVPGTGMVVAHDTLEHGIGASQGHVCGHELRALGALVFIRGEGGYNFNNIHSLETNLASDIIEVARYMHLQEGMDEGRNEPIPHSYAESVFDEVKRQFIRNLCEEGEIDREEILQCKEDFRWIMRQCIPLMREGYMAAYEAFDGESHVAIDLFREIESTVNTDYVGMYHGEKLIIEVDTNERTVKIFTEEDMWEAA